MLSLYQTNKKEKRHDLTSVQVQSDFNKKSLKSGTETDLYEDLDLSGFDKDEIPLNFGINEDFLSNDNLNSLLDNINDVAHPATEIRDSDDILKSTPLTTEQVVERQLLW